MESSQSFMVLVGSKALGKTTLASHLNDTPAFQSNFQCIDPDNNKLPLLKQPLVTFSNLKNLYPFEQRPDIFDYPFKVIWVILEGSFELAKKRASWSQNSRREYVYDQKKLREIGGYYGIPIVEVKQKSIEELAAQVLELVKDENYSFVRGLALRNLSFERIQEMDLETLIDQELLNRGIQELPEGLVGEIKKERVFGDEIVERSKQKPSFGRRLISKWLVGGMVTCLGAQITIQREDIKVQIQAKYALFLAQQGQSKLIYKVVSTNSYFKDLIFIVLKSTIYSHKKQSTGLIENLGKVRASGSKIFLEFLNRNGLDHAYRSINQQGIIISEYKQTTPIEIVFKKYFIGTDKHSYYGMQKLESVVQPHTMKYHSGIYVRFDWRNPNHISTAAETNVAENPYYFIIENQLTKEVFFEEYLLDRGKCTPFGDKCVYPDIIGGIIDLDKARLNVVKLYCTFEYYLREVGLEIQDGCFMLDQKAEVFWSEINPDCMRIKSTSLSEVYDKDIWRAGGSSSKEEILKKWSLLNKILTDYLLSHREFLQDDYPYKQVAHEILESPHLQKPYRYIYSQLVKSKKLREVILTIDISKQMPYLVVSSNASEVHSSGDVNEALDKIRFFDDILLVDLDGAFGDLQNSKKNKDIIKQITKRSHVMTGGGIKTMDDVVDLLNSGVRKVVVASNTDSAFLKNIPKDSLIVELSINESNQILIHGRKTNTKVNVIDKMKQLVGLGVHTISITFVKREGHLKGLPYSQINELMGQIPSGIRKIIIAGGITSLHDLRFLWRFENVVPQLGSAVWKNVISIEEVFNEIANFNQQGLIPAVIRAKTLMIKGQIFLNSEALKLTLKTGLLHRFSREHNQVMKKGVSSGDIQRVLKISFDCDCDSLLITVDTQKSFCHRDRKSCFKCQNLSKQTLAQISEHIKDRLKENSYAGMMQTNPGLALSKIFEEAWEMSYADSSRRVDECCDLMAHFLMYINGSGIDIQEIIEQLSLRSYRIQKIKKSKSTINVNRLIVGIADLPKHMDSEAIEKQLGIKIDRESEEIQYKVVDQGRFEEMFGGKQVRMIKVHPVDVSWLMTIGLIDMAISFNIIMNIYPEVSRPLLEKPVPSYSLCLLKRKQEPINLLDYSSKSKLNVATEYVKETHHFLKHRMALAEESIGIYKIHGVGESYLLSASHCSIGLCDALLFKKEVQHRELEIWDTILEEGQIKIGLYSSLRS